MEESGKSTRGSWALRYSPCVSENEESSAPEPDQSAKKMRPQGLVVSWPALTLTLAAVTLASLGTLIVVATMADADALATVALVLAILAFGAQLIVTAAQTMSASEQYRQVNRLYEDTRAVLQRIRAQSKMLLSNQSDQFNKILDHVLSPGAIESAVAEARGEGGDTAPENEANATSTDVNEVAKLLRAEADRALAEERVKRVIDHGLRRTPEAEELQRFPREDEARDAMERYRSLSEDAKGYLQEIANRYLKNPKAGLRLAQVIAGEISEIPSHIRELEDAGFVILEPLRRDGKTNTGRRLTARGVLAVRFFTGQGVVPAYLRDVFRERDSAEPGLR